MKQNPNLPHLLFELLRLVKRELACEELGVQSWLHLETLRFIEEKSPTMSQVAEYLRVKAPTATALIRALVEDKLIVREGDTADRRRVTLRITAKGKECLKDATKKREHAFERVITRLNAADRKEFARLLVSITQIS